MRSLGQVDLHLDLAASSGRSLRARVEHALREAVRDGRLPPGTRLPPTRGLATDLGVSRGTVAEAYAQLAAEGYLRTARGGGTRVAAVEVQPAEDGTSAGAGPEPPIRFDLDPSVPAVDGFPRAAWLAALGRAVREAPDAALGYGDPLGEPALRQALTAALGRRRGVRAAPGTLVITGGVRRGLPLVWALLAARGARRVGVEAPGWRRMAQTAERAGLEVVGIPVDEEGLDPAALAAATPDAVALTPAHQFPTGAVLSARRRGALVAWARAHGAMLVEDDFDAEFRYDRSPIGSLQGLAPDVVVHAGSASKLLAPALRLGWLVLPPALAELLRVERPDDAAAWVDPGAPPPLDQLAYANMLERGDLDRHLRRQRRRYAARREALLTALAHALPDLPVTGASAGLFLVVLLPAGTDPAAVAAHARAAGLVLAVAGTAPPALAVGYATLPEASAPVAARLVAEALAAR